MMRALRSRWVGWRVRWYLLREDRQARRKAIHDGGRVAVLRYLLRGKSK